MTTLPWLSHLDPPYSFPPLEAALSEPEGLLAAGGDLSPARLVAAYRLGIFPWYEEGQPILWWSPNPRAVLFPKDMHIPRRLRRLDRQGIFRLTADSAFGQVIAGCAAPRPLSRGTWITAAMREAYLTLHQQGIAHSLEVWLEDDLVGGLYGVALGKVFFAESMFSRESNASKIALITLGRLAAHHGIELIDCQLVNPHLNQFGIKTLPRPQFAQSVSRLAALPAVVSDWPQAVAGAVST